MQPNSNFSNQKRQSLTIFLGKLKTNMAIFSTSFQTSIIHFMRFLNLETMIKFLNTSHTIFDNHVNNMNEMHVYFEKTNKKAYCSDPLEGGGTIYSTGFFFCSVNFRRSIYSS